MHKILTRSAARFLIIAIVSCVVMGMPTQPASASNCGDVLIAGADWAGGNGLDVHHNGSHQGTGMSCGAAVYNINATTPQYGLGWQCVELAARLYKTKGWSNGLPGVDYAAQIYTNATQLGMTAMTQGAINIASIVPGDMVISNQSTYGHVSVVSSVDVVNNVVHTVEQNASGNGWADYSYNPTTKRLTRGTYYVVTGVVHDADNKLTGGSSGGGNPPPLPTGSSPIKNGGFNADTGHWSVSGSANLVRNTSATGAGTNPYEGAGFAASNASQPGDSFSETNTASISAGDTYCVSAEVVTIGPGSGSSGTLALWLLGGSNDSSTYRYTNLPGANNWQHIKTCVMATGNRTHIKVQFYPDPGSPTVGVDVVDVHQTLNASSGFNNGNGYWNMQPGTNFALYTVAHAVGTDPYEGSAFGATNTSQPGGGFTQDLPRNITTGDTFCAEAKVVTVGNTTGASGALAIHLTGTTATEQSVFYFNNLPGGNAWTNAKACVRAANPHSNIRVQVYPAVNAPTLGVDALDVHASIALNGGFNVDSSHWSPNGALGYAQFANYQGTLPYEGTGFEVVQTNQPNASLSEGRGWAWGTGDTFCAEAQVVTAGTVSGGGGTLALHLLGPGSADTSTYSFSTLSAGNGWSRIKTCAKANSGVSNGVIKVEIYPSTNNLPLGVDAVDVH